MRVIPIREYQNTPDLDKIRAVAGNPDLKPDDIFDFGTFLIAKSGTNKNHTDITPEGQKAAVKQWIGRAIYYRDHDTEAPNQIGRIYDSWTIDGNCGTSTYGRGFGVRTDDLKDIFARIENGIHREMSCGYEPVRSVCSACGSDLDPKTFSNCPKGHRVGVDGVFARDLAFQPDHISFVGRPAVEGAGLLYDATVERLGVALRRCGLAPVDAKDTTPPPAAAADIDRLSQLAEDGVEFRRWAVDEFTLWYVRSHPSPTAADDAKALADKITAREMVALARIERQRFKEILPDGKQISATPVATSEAEATDRVGSEPPPTYKDFKDIFRDLKRTYSRLEGKD